MVIFLSILSGSITGFFGWCGGRGPDYEQKHKNWPRWLLSSPVRDWGIATTTTLTALAFGAVTWLLAPSLLLTGAATSTYRYFLPKPANYTGWHYALHGFMIGLAAFPIAIYTGNWLFFLGRALLLALWMGLWSHFWKDADWEEGGRYLPVGASIWMIC